MSKHIEIDEKNEIGFYTKKLSLYPFPRILIQINLYMFDPNNISSIFFDKTC